MQAKKEITATLKKIRKGLEVLDAKECIGLLDEAMAFIEQESIAEQHESTLRDEEIESIAEQF